MAINSQPLDELQVFRAGALICVDEVFVGVLREPGRERLDLVFQSFDGLGIHVCLSDEFRKGDCAERFHDQLGRGSMLLSEQVPIHRVTIVGGHADGIFLSKNEGIGLTEKSREMFSTIDVGHALALHGSPFARDGLLHLAVESFFDLEVLLALEPVEQNRAEAFVEVLFQTLYDLFENVGICGASPSLLRFLLVVYLENPGDRNL